MILITGVSGFIGKPLLTALVSYFGKKKIVALTSSPIEECDFLLHDNYTFSADYFIDSGFDAIDTIIHLGAYTPKNSSEANHIVHCNSNILNTAKLLSAKFPALKRILYISTLDVYGDAQIITEDTVLEPSTLYGASKLYCEKMVTTWAKENDKIGQVLRVGHVYGPGEESYQKVIPNTIKNLIKKNPLIVWGSGSEIRSFIFIDDIVKAILNALKLKDNVGPINLVSDQQISIIELVQKLVEISGEKAQINYVNPDFKSKDFIFNASKMKKFLLSDEISLENGLFKEWTYMKGLRS
jgi:UDP-glucose 4-epimerase